MNNTNDLIQYLNSKWPGLTPYVDGVENSQALAAFIKDFEENFGVDVRVDGDAILLKYNMIEAKWLHGLTHQCRGHILKWDDSLNSWKYLSRPFDKFFNSGEGHSGLHTDEALNSLLAHPDTRLVSKADGSLIHVWHDDYKWKASTSGAITPFVVQDYNITFDQLFFRVLGGENRLFPLHKGLTYMFELCADENRVLTKYPDDRIYLLGARYNDSGEYVDSDSLDILADALGANVLRPTAYKPKDVGVFDRNSLHDFVEKETKRVDMYGEYAEGFIIYNNNIPRAKVKCSQYLALHGFSGGDVLHTKGLLIDAFFNGSSDDIVPLIPKSLVAYLERLKEWYSNEKRVIVAGTDELVGRKYETPKDFALKVQSVGGQHQAYFFKHKEAFMRGEKPDPETITHYFRNHWTRFEKGIKAL